MKLNPTYIISQPYVKSFMCVTLTNKNVGFEINVCLVLVFVYLNKMDSLQLSDSVMNRILEVEKYFKPFFFWFCGDRRPVGQHQSRDGN